MSALNVLRLSSSPGREMPGNVDGADAAFQPYLHPPSHFGLGSISAGYSYLASLTRLLRRPGTVISTSSLRGTSSMLTDTDMPILFKITARSGDLGNAMLLIFQVRTEFESDLDFYMAALGWGRWLFWVRCDLSNGIVLGAEEISIRGAVMLLICMFFLPFPHFDLLDLFNCDHDGLDGRNSPHHHCSLADVSSGSGAPHVRHMRTLLDGVYRYDARRLLGFGLDSTTWTSTPTAVDGSVFDLAHCAARPRLTTGAILQVTTTRLQLEHNPLPGPLILLPSLSVQSADYIRGMLVIFLPSSLIFAVHLTFALMNIVDLISNLVELNVYHYYVHPHRHGFRHAVNWDLGFNIVLSGRSPRFRYPLGVVNRDKNSLLAISLDCPIKECFVVFSLVFRRRLQPCFRCRLTPVFVLVGVTNTKVYPTNETATDVWEGPGHDTSRKARMLPVTRRGEGCRVNTLISDEVGVESGGTTRLISVFKDGASAPYTQKAVEYKSSEAS
ncbi:hypothetical protein BDZ89DRAFT_1038356 [Hymenopellis radicata]|nr:hypothetical protein BDZ89DRAFT_1038356 [Hymenopellis radicata]